MKTTTLPIFLRCAMALLALLPLAGVASLAGCDRSEAGKVTLLLAIPANADKDSPYPKAVAAFEKEHPDIDVKIMQISGTYYQKLLIMIAGGKGPDVMWMGQSFNEFAARGIFMDINDQLAREADSSAIYPDVLSWYRVGDKQFGIPFGIDSKFIVYNKNLFDEVQAPYPTNDWNIDQFMDRARKLTRDRDGDGRTDQYGFMGDLDYTIFGANICTPDGLAASCNTPEMMEYFRVNLKMRNEDRIALAPPIRPEEALSIFTTGKVAMMQVATWDLTYMRDRLTNFDWDIVPNPTAWEQAHWASSQGMVIRSDTKHPHESWLLLKAFLSPDFQRGTSKFSIPADRNIAREIVARNTERPHNLETLLIAADSLRPNPRVPNMMEVMQSYFNASSAVWSGQASPQAAMAAADIEINAALRRARMEAAR